MTDVIKVKPRPISSPGIKPRSLNIGRLGRKDKPAPKPPPSKRVEAPDRPEAPRRHPANKPRNHHKASRLVPPKFEGETVVCCATGPGLTTEVIETIRPYHERGVVKVAGLNDSYRVVDFLDVFYACDEKWWDVHTRSEFVAQQPQGVMEIDAEMWGNQTAFSLLRKYPHVNIVQGQGKPGFSTERNVIHWGNNSGFQLLNLVYLMRAERMLLVGYNMGVPEGRDVHFFGKHPPGLSQGGSQYKGFTRMFDKIQPEIRERIFNATEETMLKCFPRVDLADALAKIERGESLP